MPKLEIPFNESCPKWKYLSIYFVRYLYSLYQYLKIKIDSHQFEKTYIYFMMVKMKELDVRWAAAVGPF